MRGGLEVVFEVVRKAPRGGGREVAEIRFDAPTRIDVLYSEPSRVSPASTVIIKRRPCHLEPV